MSILDIIVSYFFLMHDLFEVFPVIHLNVSVFGIEKNYKSYIIVFKSVIAGLRVITNGFF